MKGFIVIAVILSCFLVPVPFAYSHDDVTQVPACKYCGMNRETFAHSRVLTVYADGKPEGTCSLHCAAVDMALNIDRDPVQIMVGDYNSKTLVDAEKAFWVLGGSKPGVMTKRGKWAFSTKESAEAFIAQNGGVLANFDTVIKAAFEDMYQDTKMIRERRAQKRKALDQKK